MKTESPAVRRRAMATLSRIGPAGAPVLLRLVSDPQRPDRGFAAYSICFSPDIGTNARPAVSVLIRGLEAEDATTAANAARGLGWLGIEAELVVPALVKSLQDPGPLVRAVSAKSLGQFGDWARLAAPALRTALNDSERIVRSAAREALQKFAPEVLSEAGPSEEESARPIGVK